LAGPPRLRAGTQRRRTELIRVACRVFAEKGFDGASLQDIADEFGVLKGSLFHYIQTKEELLLEIVEGVYQDAAREVWVIAQEEDEAVNRLRRVIVAYAVFISRNLDEVTVWMHDFNALPDARRKALRELEERDRHRLEELIAEAQREGGIRADVDPRLAALALLGSINWLHRWFQPRRLSAEEIGSRFSDLFLAGLTPR
jgi:AcrR family transcriptional regulator